MIKYEVIHPKTKKVISTRNSASNREYHWAVTYINPVTGIWYDAQYSNERVNAERNLVQALDRIRNGYKDWTPEQRAIALASCKGYAVTEVAEVKKPVKRPVARRTPVKRAV